jgi:hypothetical protein
VPTGSVDDVRARLESIGEELADLALDRLREAIAAGDETSDAERRITRARRSVEKAAILLAQVDGPEE